MNFYRLISAASFLLLLNPGSAVFAEDSADAGSQQDTLELGSTSVTGNQELPKVLYIVPWQDSRIGDLEGRPVNSLLEEVLAPVDRDVFQRQVRYFEQLYGAETGSDADE